MATRDLRADGKGRHTTAHRELCCCRAAACVIDTPGLRGVGLHDVARRRSTLVFADVEELAAAVPVRRLRARAPSPAARCCAAVDAGELPQRRLESWRKLQREARWMARATTRGCAPRSGRGGSGSARTTAAVPAPSAPEHGLS